MDDEYKKVFIEETQEIIEELEGELLELEKDPEGEEVIAKIFRGIHTIKGSGAMFGFDSISEFAHGIEDVFSEIRDGNIKVKKKLIDVCFKSLDYIGRSIEGDVSKEEGNVILLEVKKIYEDDENAVSEDTSPKSKGPVIDPDSSKPDEINTDLTSSESETVVQPAKSQSEKIFRIVLKPSKSISTTGVDIDGIFESLKARGTLVTIAHTSKIPKLKDIQEELCYISWDILYKTCLSHEEVMDEFVFLDNDSEVKINKIDEESDEDTEYKRLGEILLEKGDIDRKSLDLALQKQTNIGNILIESGVKSETIQAAVIEQELIKEKIKEKKEKTYAKSLRVSSVKVDHLVNLVGEMVTLQARISEYSNSRSDDTVLLTLSEEFERMVWDVRDSTMEMRMIPIGSTFSRFKRLVRDLSTSMGKNVKIETSGEDTELDKTVIEQLGDPLVHIIRNCVDHGIEKPEDRKASGKDPMGTIWLSAFHSGSNVHVEVKDDGKGLDLDVIRKKGIEKGLIHAKDDLSDNDIAKLIFHPGFSTAQLVSDVSGRGVGMDVVKRNIESLRGTIDVNTEKGRGTEISLQIPLTLAIIDGLLVKISNEYFVVPLGMVEECIEIEHKIIIKNEGRAYVNIRDEIVPYVYLRNELMLGNHDLCEFEQIVVTNEKKRRVGLVVDEVVGEHQTVIKSLSDFYKGVKGVSGATIMGDGRIALILDVHALVNLVTDFETKKSVSGE